MKDPSIFHQKMNDLKQKLNSINNDIVEIQKNQRSTKNTSPIYQKDIKRKKKESYNLNKYKNKNKKSIITKQNKKHFLNKQINIEDLLNKELIENLTIPNDMTHITPSNNIYINKNFYENLEHNKVQRRVKNEITNYDIIDNIQNNKDQKTLRNIYAHSNILNIGKELSFRKIDNDNIKDSIKYSNAFTSRNPISLRANKSNDPLLISSLNKQIDIEQKKHIINHRYNDNIMINNNNTICITCDNETFQNDGKINKKVIPSSNSNISNFYSFISSQNKNLLDSKKEKDNLSNDFELIRNETQIPFHKVGEKRILEISGDNFGSDKSLKLQGNKENSKNRIIYDLNENMNNKNKKKIKLINFQNRKKFNSISCNKLMINRNALVTDRSNKLVRNKLFNISENLKNSNTTLDKEKLIVKINRQIYSRNKKNKSFKNSPDNKKIHDPKTENEISPNIMDKLNQNIIDSKIKNNFIMKLIKLYYESTGINLNKKNDLNSTLNILYNWIENMTKKNNIENKKINEEIQYKKIRNKIMNQYQLKNKNELKSFLNKILGNDV